MSSDSHVSSYQEYQDLVASYIGYAHGGEDDNSTEMILRKLSPLMPKTRTGQAALGGAGGLVTGYLAMRVGKTAAFTAGAVLLLLQIGHYQGYVKVDWDKLNKDLASRGTEFIRRSRAPNLNTKSITDFLHRNKHMTGGFLAGLLCAYVMYPYASSMRATVRPKQSNSVLKFAKLCKQTDKKLKKDFVEFDKIIKMKVKAMDREREFINTEMINTHHSRVDSSAVYIGALPDVTEGPKVKPLKNDKDYITRCVVQKQARWKRREELSMSQLIDKINDKLDEFDKHIAAQREDMVTYKKRHHFLPSLHKSQLYDECSDEEEITPINMRDYVDFTRMQVRHLKNDAKKTRKVPSLPSIHDRKTSDKQRQGKFKPSHFSNKSNLASISEYSRMSIVEEDSQRSSLLGVSAVADFTSFSDVYSLCSQSRYLRKGTPLNRNPDISQIFT